MINMLMEALGRSRWVGFLDPLQYVHVFASGDGYALAAVHCVFCHVQQRCRVF